MENHFYKDKVCVVTGASSGVGFATTKLLLEEEAIVYAIDCKPVDIFGVITIPCDLTNKESIDNAFLNIPDEIDCFFGAANVSGLKADYYTTFTVNFIANKYITEEYLKVRMNPGGSICFVSSTAGNYWDKYSVEYRSYMKANTWDKLITNLHKKADPDTVGVLAYPLSKRALNYYMSEKAIEFGDRNIRVNTVLPAVSDTAMLEEFSADDAQYDAVPTGVANRVPDPSEIAKPILFLNSDLASYISGVCLNIDYGNDSLIRLGKKRDRFDMKVNSKLFNVGFVQNQMMKQLDGSSIESPETTPDIEYDENGIEIL